MKKIYILLFFGIVLCQTSLAQSSIIPDKSSTEIEELSIYPNPVTEGVVYISTKKNVPKNVIIYDILGNTVLKRPLSTKELNVSGLSKGIYIMQITERKATAIRKLVVR